MRINLYKRSFFKHSAKGSTWEKHKYLKRIDGTYYYPDGYDGGRHLSDLEEKESEEETEKEETPSGKLDLSEEEIDRAAREVIRGGFGNGQMRKDLLGENYQEIQNRVNEIMEQYKNKKVSDATDNDMEKLKETADKVNKKQKKSNVHSGVDMDKVMSVYEKRKKR